MGLENLHGGH